MLVFDHVALAAAGVIPLQRFLAGRHGGIVIGGGTPEGSGFRAMQLRLGRGEEGMTIELLEPWDAAHNDFLQRFVTSNGAGPHHFTFKTNDIEAELERVRGLGFEPVAVNFDNPGWREFFIHPKQSHGPVVQIAQSGGDRRSMAEVLERALEGELSEWGSQWWSDLNLVRGSAVSTLERVVIATPDVDAGIAFYGDVLGGVVARNAKGASITWSGGTLALEEVDVERPAIDRLEMSGDNVADEAVELGTRFVAV